jgi:hypothetical protein
LLFVLFAFGPVVSWVEEVAKAVMLLMKPAGRLASCARCRKGAAFHSPHTFMACCITDITRKYVNTLVAPHNIDLGRKSIFVGLRETGAVK